MSEATLEGRSFNAQARIDALDVRSIVDTVREPLLILDGHLRVQSANRSFYRTFRVSAQDTEGRLLYDLGNGQWDIPRLRVLLEEILPHDTVFDDFELTHDFPDIGHKVMLLNARRLPQEDGDRILLAMEDVTERRQLEAERQEIETHFTALVKNVEDHSIFTLDPEGRVTSWNVAAENILGYTEAEALGQHFAFIFTPEDHEHGIPEVELRTAREQGRADDERWHLRKGGERFWALGIVSALYDAEGRLTGFSKILRDMTASKRAEEAIQASDERQGLLLKLSDALNSLADPNRIQATAAHVLGEHLGVTRAMYADVDGEPGSERGILRGKYLGADAEALAPFPERYDYRDYGERAMALRRRGEALVVADVTTDPEFSAAERAAWAAGGVRAAITVPLVKEGRFVADFGVQSATAREWTANQVALVKETAERTWAAVERARAEAVLRENKERQAFLLELTDAQRRGGDAVEGQEAALRLVAARLRATRAAFYVVDPGGDGFVMAAGFETADAGDLPRHMRHTDYGVWIEEQYRAGQTILVQDTEVDARTESERAVYRAIGVRAWVGVPLLENGRIDAILGVHSATPREWTCAEIDLLEEVAERTWAVAERARAETALRESELKYRALVEQAADGIWLADREGSFVSVNPAGCKILGYSHDEHVRLTVQDMIRAADTPRLSELMQALAVGKQITDVWEIRRADGTFVPLELSYSITPAGFWQAIGRDITERIEAEQALRQSEERLNLATDATELAVFEWDLTSNCVTANDRFRQWYGIGSGEPMTASQLIRERVHPSDRTFVEAQLRQAMDPTSSGRYNFEYRLVPPAGGGVRWILTCGQVRFEGAGDDRRPVRVLGTNLDITERKQTEARLKESDRRKDAFLATLAHELRNPLAPIRTGLELVDALRGDAAACEEPVRIMERQVSHLVRLIDDLLDVSRISRGKIVLRTERLALADVIDDALEMSDSGLSGDDPRLTVDVPSERLEVEGDRVRLVQVVANLLNNAAKFTEAGGRIDLRVIPRGERVEIQVEDDGQGIPRDRLDSIFEMFSQAEPGVAGGLGIGLSLVRGLVEMHGGTVSADSAGPGCGATFTLSLPLGPRAAAPPTVDTATPGAVDPVQGRVLVVDDHRDIAKGLELLLTRLGAEVRVAYDGHEAIRVFGEWAPTHVLMDLGMPGMDGYEAARRLRARYPDRVFRLIAATGWGQEEDRRRTREAGFDEHLVKPVRTQELREVLSRQAAGPA